ncbi:GTP cyclohydrolase II-domain-containing protein [Mucidula mucida]|nr:GTP cyclohydrolase II-domain-containing protein [Mucidula mucida]
MVRPSHEAFTDADAALLDLLTGPVAPTVPKTAFARRDAALDPLIMAAAFASGPHVTRNHYHHDFFPGVMLPKAEGSWDWTKFSGSNADAPPRKKLAYVSRQAPRKQKAEATFVEKENVTSALAPTSADNQPPRKRRTWSISTTESVSTRSHTSSSSSTLNSSAAELEVKCMARTRIPTPHGPAFLHLYHNNRDSKEHLAIVIDSSQFSPGAIVPPPIRSRSLDAVWSPSETEMDRITRGAYVGRLSAAHQHASHPRSGERTGVQMDNVPSPLIRIHSECFTGETVGSMRCDCGEQLDEAIRLISQPITIPSSSPFTPPTTIPGRGAVVYLRQEGRGIGLLSKIRAYNLQDLGHDTVTANLMLGHGADERGYDIAIAILRDLGLAADAGEGVRVLTNNPDKVEALEKDGLRVVERVPMIPRSWKLRHPGKHQPDEHISEKDEDRIVGATLIGGNAVYGEDLDKYLRTKVLKMGHMLPLWMENGVEEI